MLAGAYAVSIAPRSRSEVSGCDMFMDTSSVARGVPGKDDTYMPGVCAGTCVGRFISKSINVGLVPEPLLGSWVRGEVGVEVKSGDVCCDAIILYSSIGSAVWVSRNLITNARCFSQSLSTMVITIA